MAARRKAARLNPKLKKLRARDKATREDLIAALTQYLAHQRECCDHVEQYLTDLSNWLENDLKPTVDWLLSQAGATGELPPHPKFP